MRITFLVKLDYQKSTVTLSVDIKYSMRDVIFDQLLYFSRELVTSIK